MRTQTPVTPKPIMPGQQHAAVSDICANRRISRATFYRALRAPGSPIRTKKLGSRTLVDVASVDTWIASLPAA